MKENEKSQAVFDFLLERIVQGRYGSGTRLPSERELAGSLHASRATVRDALQRLAAWDLIEARRGSGSMVRPRKDWSFEVLPSYLACAMKREDGLVHTLELVRDLLTLRRSILASMLPVMARRLSPGALLEARGALREAWAKRSDGLAFVEADLRMLRKVLEATGILPAVWLLNRLSQVYLEAAGVLSAFLPPPEDYLEAHESFFNALEGNDSRTAERIIMEYLRKHDAQLGPVEDI